MVYGEAKELGSRVLERAFELKRARERRVANCSSWALGSSGSAE